MIRLDVRNSRELQATLLAIRRAPSEIQKQVRQQTKAKLLPEWQKGLRERADTRLQHRVLADTAKATVSNQNVRLSSAGSAKKLSGGLQPSKNGRGVEFGASPEKYRTYDRRSKNGGTHKVTRRTGRPMGPTNRKGNVIFPTVSELIPRFASLWVQTTIRTFYDAIEGKR